MHDAYKEAVYRFNLAARQGNFTAEYSVGRSYYYGQGVKKNYKSAVYRFNLAARQGYSLAQAVLGYAYYKGNGITKNYIKALKWFIIARSYGFVFSKKYCLLNRALNNLLKHRLNAKQIKIAVNEAKKYRPIY